MLDEEILIRIFEFLNNNYEKYELKTFNRKSIYFYTPHGLVRFSDHKPSKKFKGHASYSYEESVIRKHDL